MRRGIAPAGTLPLGATAPAVTLRVFAVEVIFVAVLIATQN